MAMKPRKIKKKPTAGRQLKATAGAKPTAAKPTAGRQLKATKKPVKKMRGGGMVKKMRKGGAVRKKK